LKRWNYSSATLRHVFEASLMPTRASQKTQEFRGRSERIEQDKGKKFPLIAKYFPQGA
jgi:hypothetical protein